MRGAGGGPGALEEGRVTIAIEGLGLSDPGPGPAPRPHRRFTLKRILIASGALLGTLLLLTGSFIGISLYRIDHAVHHVGVSASLLAKGKNDLLAIVKGPDHTEQVFVFHDTGGAHQHPADPAGARPAHEERQHRPAGQVSACTHRPPSSPASTVWASP